MASPQKENGYTPIANEFLEKIYGEAFTSSELRIFLTVLRFTYGLSRKTHKMSGSFIAKATGLNARATARVLKDLIRKNVILETAKNSYTESREIGLNKNYEAWSMYSGRYTPDSTQCTAAGGGYVPSKGEEVCTAQYSKITKVKTKIKTSVQESVFPEPFNRFWDVYPKRQAKQDALKAFRKLNPNDELLKVITEAVKRLTNMENWQRDKGLYIPLPATYLNGRRWEDEMPPNRPDETKPKRNFLN
ncbi:MAG: replication protein [Eubacteriales bacterium]